MDLSKIGKFIYKLRTEKGLSQASLAEMIPITRQAVSRWELGKSLPDSQTLVILSKIFNVSINEILAGERNNEQSKKNVTLNLVDEINAKKKKIKMISVISIITVISILFLFLCYYFINSYNSIKVYKIRGENNNFYTYNGIMISTKQKTYIRVGELVSENEKSDIEKLKLYFIDKNKEEQVLYEDSKTDILITSDNGYLEKLTKEELDYLINNLYLEIYYSDKTDKIKLDLEKDFANSFHFNKKYKLESESDSNDSSNLLIYDIIKDKMKEKGTETKDGLIFITNDEDKVIKIELINNQLLLEIKSSTNRISWRGYFNNNFSVRYEEGKDTQIKRTTFIATNYKSLSKENKIIYDNFIKNINKYLLNS